LAITQSAITQLAVKQLAVTLKIARVRSEIFPRRKLDWIDENRHHHSIRALFRIADQ